MSAPGSPPVHLSGYQNRDREVIDYGMTELEDSGLWFRSSPPPNPGGRKVAFIGAAQTFGCFCEKPFPDLLAERLGITALNLGYGGAGPEFFLGQKKLVEQLNGCDLVVIQAMSGRSQSNSAYESGGLEYLTRRSDGTRLGANEAYREVLEGPRGLHALGTPGTKAARVLGRRRLRRLVNETRRAWVKSNLDLVEALKVPAVFFWFSKRTPSLPDDLTTVKSLFGEFPQMVNTWMVEEVRRSCAGYAECVSERGSPQPLFSRLTGEPVTVDPANDRPDLGGQPAWSENLYYPSPEMHEDAADCLLPVLKDLL